MGGHFSTTIITVHFLLTINLEVDRKCSAPFPPDADLRRDSSLKNLVNHKIVTKEVTPPLTILHLNFKISFGFISLFQISPKSSQWYLSSSFLILLKSPFILVLYHFKRNFTFRLVLFSSISIISKRRCIQAHY